MHSGVPAVVVSLALVLGSSSAPLRGDEPQGRKPGLQRLGWLPELAGSCWSGLLPDGKTRDTQCYEVRLGHFLFGRIQIREETPAPGAAAQPGPKPPHPGGFEGEGFLAWDAKKERIVFSFWSSDGNFGQSEALVDGALIHFPHTARPGSTAPEQRSTWRRLDADSFKVSRESRADDGWKEMWSVVYARVR